MLLDTAIIALEVAQSLAKSTTLMQTTPKFLDKLKSGRVALILAGRRAAVSSRKGGLLSATRFWLELRCVRGLLVSMPPAPNSEERMKACQCARRLKHLDILLIESQRPIEPSRDAGRMVSWKMKPIVFACEYLVVDKNIRYRSRHHDGCQHDQWQQCIAGSM